MPDDAKPAILVVTTVPPDLRAKLASDYQLVDLEHLRCEAGAASPDLSRFKIALTTSMAGADETLMAQLPQLGLIACNGAGLDKIDLKAAASRGIAVCHTPDELTEDVADFTIGLIYAASRRLVEGDRFVRTGGWLKGRMTLSRSLVGKTLGIVGLGKIGTAIARRAVGLGLEVVYHGRRPKPHLDYAFEPDIGRLAERADILVLSCAGGEETHHLIGVDILARLGPDGILVNVSRGSVVDEEALIIALQAGSIAAAALDVFASEPRIDERFLALDNVVLQPHYAALTFETRAAMVGRIHREITAFLEGRPLHDAARR
ncbi:Lactate dehydrogenase [Rhizobiales bacterium GAS191]|nr:Lactate dehydrogenase [Rhizobiales bacterium GAS191]